MLYINNFYNTFYSGVVMPDGHVTVARQGEDDIVQFINKKINILVVEV